MTETKVLLTGSAGFIGFHLAQVLLADGFRVHGFDGMTDYYDVTLKQRRHQILLQTPGFTMTQAMLEDDDTLQATADDFQPDIIVHLAAQAGVRYSLEAPRSYVESNIVGTFNVMEAARRHKVRHLLMASTSSIYGASTDMPFAETQKVDAPLTIYAATKKANEAMGHAYAHLHDLPTTMFRFFTVYGPWGRPDLAFFKFTKAILEGRPIDVYNHGQMYRDFTYVGDLVHGIRLLIDTVPVRPQADGLSANPAISDGLSANPELHGVVPEGDSLSPIAPFRIVNIGNSDKVRLMDFIEAIEDATGRKAERNYMEMQTGDVPATWADATLLQSLTGYRPQTDIREGMRQFVAWYREYYGV